MPKTDKEIEELIKENPKLAEYIKQLRKQNEIDKRDKENRASKRKPVSRAREERKEKEESEGLEILDPRKFSLMQEVKKHPLYKKSNRDAKARAMIDEYKKNQEKKMTSKNNITPGQLVLFKYLNPKTKEELEYYDASPCTIFFGIFYFIDKA